MPLSQSSLAPAVGASVKNVVFKPVAQVLPRKILLIGTYDETTYTSVVENVPQLATSAEDIGSKTGFGFMLHSLAVDAFKGGQYTETWWIAQPEDVAATAASGTITFVGTITQSGTLYLYIAGLAVPVPLAQGDDPTAVATKCAAAITADDNLPVTSTSLAAVLTITSKSKGPWGNDISITFNWGFREEFPLGLVSATVVDMAGGAGVPDIDDALLGLGTGSNSNELHFTDVNHGYGLDTTTMDKLSTYNGSGNEAVGCYAKTVARPFRVLYGDVGSGSTGLNTLVALGNGRRSDRTNGILPVPGSPNHPAKIAALALSNAARINNNRAEESYRGIILDGVIPGASADRWTSDYDSMDAAVKAGIGVSDVEGGAVVISTLRTFYHPSSIPVSSNTYANMRNVSIQQNILYNVQSTFKSDNWKGISLVASLSKVSNAVDRLKARDLEAVKDALFALAESFESQAWIYTAEFTKKNIVVQIRTLSNGFDAIMPVILSISGDILDVQVQADTSIAVLL